MPLSFGISSTFLTLGVWFAERSRARPALLSLPSCRRTGLCSRVSELSAPSPLSSSHAPNLKTGDGFGQSVVSLEWHFSRLGVQLCRGELRGRCRPGWPAGDRTSPAPPPPHGAGWPLSGRRAVLLASVCADPRPLPSAS